MNQFSTGSQRIPNFHGWIRGLVWIGTLCCMGLLYLTGSAQAHHPFGGSTPSTGLEGFLSGLGHPVIGVDHLAFVLSTGLLALQGGLGIPVAFVLASVAGTGVHLLDLSLPAPESIIAASVALFGLMLALKKRPPAWILIILAGLSGLFHGYAYGEAVVGAEMGSLLAYLLGFSLVQMLIAIAPYLILRRMGSLRDEPDLWLRFGGFTLLGIGGSLLWGILIG